MSDQKKTRFNLRNFVSVLLTFSFAVLVFTGVILFITPPGRVAHWTGWTMLGLGKEQWGATHICFSICVIIASILHICLNFKPLVNYFKNRFSNKFTARPEWILALIICLAIFAGAFYQAPPFSSIMDINHKIKFSWDDPAQQAPVPHAETLTLADLAIKADLDLDELIANLKAAGIEPAKPETVLSRLANKYNLTPNAVYNIAIDAKSHPKAPAKQPGCQDQRKGLGKKTLNQFCEEEGIDVQSAIDALGAAEIPAAPDDTLRRIADKALTNPGEIAKMITSSQSK